MAARSWRWLAVRIVGLFARPPAGYAEAGDGQGGTIMKPVWATRIQTRTN